MQTYVPKLVFKEKVEPFYNKTWDKHNTDYEGAEDTIGEFQNGDVAKYASDKYEELPAGGHIDSRESKPCRRGARQRSSTRGI